MPDVRLVGADAVPRVDVIAGGFPCKGASTAGKRNGFGHPETVLWREMARAVRELRPRYVLVENVANILALHDGAVWGEVVRELAALGFDIRWDCFPAAAFGAPHLRDRVSPLLPPRARRGGNTRGAGSIERGGGMMLSQALKLLPSPAATEYGSNRSPLLGAAVRPSLDGLLKLLLTPVASDGRAKGGGGRWNGSSAPLEQTIKDEAFPSAAEATWRPSGGGRRSSDLRLSPWFVEWMMGAPAGWSDPACQHSATEFSRTTPLPRAASGWS